MPLDTMETEMAAKLDELEASLPAEDAVEVSLKNPAEQASGDVDDSKSGTPATPPAKEEMQPAKPEEQKTEQPEKTQDTKASRYEKEKARAQTQWERIKAENEANRAEAERLKKEREEFQRERQILQEQASKPRERQYTRQEYLESAEYWTEEARKLEANGAFELAAEKKALADGARKAAQMAAPGPDPQQAQLEAKVSASWERAKLEMPDVVKPGHPLNAKVKGFLEANPELLRHPNGPHLATVFCKAELDAARVPDLEKERQSLLKETETLKAKVRELETATSLGGSGSGPITHGSKSWDDMTIEEQESSLLSDLRGASQR